jgi:putative endonuclease
MAEEKPWYVYMIECNNETFYTGVSNDVGARIKKHDSGKGSKYVKSVGGVKRLVGTIKCVGKSQACKEEYRIKQLTRNEKLDLFYKSTN